MDDEQDWAVSTEQPYVFIGSGSRAVKLEFGKGRGTYFYVVVDWFAIHGLGESNRLLGDFP